MRFPPGRTQIPDCRKPIKKSPGGRGPKEPRGPEGPLLSDWCPALAGVILSAAPGTAAPSSSLFSPCHQGTPLPAFNLGAVTSTPRSLFCCKPLPCSESLWLLWGRPGLTPPLPAPLPLTLVTSFPLWGAWPQSDSGTRLIISPPHSSPINHWSGNSSPPAWLGGAPTTTLLPSCPSWLAGEFLGDGAWRFWSIRPRAVPLTHSINIWGLKRLMFVSAP